MKYFIYENRRIKKAGLHKGTCFHVLKQKPPTDNGEWYGPFDTVEEAVAKQELIASKYPRTDAMGECWFCIRRHRANKQAGAKQNSGGYSSQYVIREQYADWVSTLHRCSCGSAGKPEDSVINIRFHGPYDSVEEAEQAFKADRIRGKTLGKHSCCKSTDKRRDVQTRDEPRTESDGEQYVVYVNYQKRKIRIHISACGFAKEPGHTTTVGEWFGYFDTLDEAEEKQRNIEAGMRLGARIVDKCGCCK